MRLRPYQQQLTDGVRAAWAAGNRVVLMQASTGAGKTPMLADVLNHHDGFAAVLVHRDKLVEQISLTLARGGVRHDLIASDKTKRIIARKHVKKLGQCFYSPGARARVASVQTLVKAKGLEKWLSQVTLWIGDEGHHFLAANSWGTCVSKFTHPACHGLLVTATPGRPDGQGLGRHADGFADAMVMGPPMRWLIDEGYLCDYDVVCPPSDMRVAEAPKGTDGDYTPTQRREAARNSHIVGDVPAHYLKFAAGKSGITFCGDIETATATVTAYREAGVSAELITGDTDPTIRDQIFDRAEGGSLNQIVAVDVISEGVDIPALQVGSFARLTSSHIVWLQQLGRLLRPIYASGYDLSTREGRLAAIAASSKPRALLIDHISGFINPQLGPPDKPREWSLDRRDKKAKQNKSDDMPLRVCTNPAIDCFYPYERVYRACPKCGYAPEPASRSAPEHVDGDLQMLDPAALAVLRGAVIDPHKPRGQFEAEQLAKGAASKWLNGHWNAYMGDSAAQLALRESMDRWAGQLHAAGHSDCVIQRRFYLGYGVDILGAMALKEKDAMALKERIDGTVNRG